MYVYTAILKMMYTEIGPTLNECFTRLESDSFPVRFLPEVVEAGHMAGCTTHAWYGIPEGVTVGAALGDFQCTFHSGLHQESDAG